MPPERRWALAATQFGSSVRTSHGNALAEHRNAPAGEVTVSASREIASADLSNPSAQGGNGPAEKKIVSAAKKVTAPD